jgi:peptide/nickel transport system substrate-binding protein
MKKPKIVLLVLLGIILASSLVLGSCGEDATTTPPPSTTGPGTTTPGETTTPPAAPKPEGTFTFGIDTMGSEGFLPWITFQTDWLLFGAVYDTLALETPEGVNIPSVAESWEWSDDYTDLTLHIREGIQFHDGWGELTAEDVAYNINKHMSDESTSLAKSYMAIIESVEVVDPYTVVVHQSVPNVDYAEMYAFGGIAGAVTCKAYVESVGPEEANINPVGSGPYKLIEHKVGNYLKYEAVEDHWRVVPEYKYLVIQSVPEESTRVAMLQTGAIDATIISPNSLSDLSEDDFTIDYWRYGPNTLIIFGGMCRPANVNYYQEGYHNQDPWVDIRVREAMNLAIDRDAINLALHKGTAKPMTIPFQIPGWTDLEPYPYDPDRARELLAEAAADGVFTPNAEGGFSLTFISPTHPGTPMAQKEAEAVAGYWADIGIDADISPLDFGAYWPKVEAAENVGECYTFRLAYAGTNPYSYLLMCVVSDNLWGGRFQVPEMEEITPLAEAALAELDLEVRDGMYRNIAQQVYDNYVAVPLIQVPFIVVKNKTVGDWPPNSSSYYYNFEYIQHAEPLNTFRLFEIWD